MKFLTAHLDDVEESYFEHMRFALGFAIEMLAASFACAVHALMPFLFSKTGSNCIVRLHERMVTNRHNLSARKRGRVAADGPTAV